MQSLQLKMKMSTGAADQKASESTWQWGRRSSSLFVSFTRSPRIGNCFLTSAGLFRSWIEDIAASGMSTLRKAMQDIMSLNQSTIETPRICAKTQPRCLAANSSSVSGISADNSDAILEPIPNYCLNLPIFITNTITLEIVSPSIIGIRSG